MPRPASRVRAPRAVGAFGALGALGALGLAWVVAACSDEPERTVASYCQEVSVNLPALVGPVIGTDDDVEAVLATYRSIAAVAPATVAPEWETVVSTLETVSTVVPSDPASLEAANMAALTGQPSYTRIQQYTQVECSIAIGTPPTPTNPVTATTLPPPTSAASDG